MENEVKGNNMDWNIFEGKDNFLRFIDNSILQYVRLRFGSRKGLISFVNANFGTKIPETATYTRISEVLKENSKDLYKDVIRLSPIEIAHLYSFYKVLTDTFWETFSPFYAFLFNEKIRIGKKSELRKYATRIIEKFDQNELTKKWIELTSSSGEYRPVIQL